MQQKQRYFVVHKPFGYISQFSNEHHHKTLADLDFKFPKNCYPVGRLDTDSEGLLIVSNDKNITELLLNPKNKHSRIYYAQVEGLLNEERIFQFKHLIISINGKEHRCKKAEIKSIEPPRFPERNPPVRYRKTVPDCWVEIKLTEGKNRQVRRMTAAIGLPTLRLVRVSIENLNILPFEPGKVDEYTKEEIYKLLKLDAK